jgi:hypothetical protein
VRVVSAQSLDRQCAWSEPDGRRVFLELHSTTQTLTTHTHTHLYEYTYANFTPMGTSGELSTGRSGDSRSHHWRLVVDGNVAYHLTHTPENPGIYPGKGVSTTI